MAWLPGIGELKEAIAAQNVQIAADREATVQHRAWEAAQLGDLKGEAEQIKALAVKTNGRVNEHDIELAVIHKAEEEELKLEAAKVKAEGDSRDSRRSWRQLAFSACLGAAGLLIVSLAVFWLTGTGMH